MGFSNDKIKTKMRELVCKKYITTDSKGQIKFKSYLNDAIQRGDISKDDALYISLELMFSIRNYNFNYKNICNELEELVLRVKEYNFSESENIKKSILFFHNYDFECKVLSEYIDELSLNSIIDDKNNVSQKNKPKDIKKYFDHFSREELCYILGINPDLNFDKEKMLKKQVANEFLKYDSDYNKLVDASCEDIKKYLESLSEELDQNQSNELVLETRKHINEDKEKRIKEASIRIAENKSIQQTRLNSNKNQKKNKRQFSVEKSNEYKPSIYSRPNHNSEKIKSINKEKEISKNLSEKEFKDLLQKIKLFNHYWTLESKISLRSEYSEIYYTVCTQNLDALNEDIKLFRVFYQNFDKIEESIKIVDKISQNEFLFKRFFQEFNINNPHTYGTVLLNYKKLYDAVYAINEYPYFLKNEIFKKIDYLKKFIENYEILLDKIGIKKYNGMGKVELVELTEKINFFNDKQTEKENEINFFKDIKDPNKKRAIVCDEDNVKVVAGAGAGKTFIIEKRVNYLIKNGIDPEKILCLCYTKKGVNQLNKKVNNPSNKHKVKVFTFHEFCRRVSNECGEDKSSNRYLLDRVIRKYVENIVRDQKKLDNLCKYFSYYSRPQLEEYEEYREQNKFVSLKKKYNYCDRNLDVSERKNYSLCHKNNETIEGECVKSMGELLIANYLFMHNIEYRYESQYPYNDMADVIKNRFLYSANYFSLDRINKKFENERLVNDFIKWEKHKQYFPDFYLPEYDIYIEHFGVNENMEATFLKGEEKEKYEGDMKYKSIQHSIYGTKLIKTYWYYLLEDRLLKELEGELNKYPEVEIKQRSREEIIDILINNERVKDFSDFSKLVKSFINIYESKNLHKADFDIFRLKNTSNNVYTKNRQNLFFDIAEDIYNTYYNENLKGTLSHNHEIFNALNLIQTKKFKGKYDYIFVDEYQDVNPVRCKLLQELQKNSNAKLFVVGDDWQSIYGFTGSKVDLFIDFDRYFENPEVIQIEENRRNPQKLIDISTDFIVKYNGQDERKLTYYKGFENNNPNPIKVVKYNKDSWKVKTLKLDAVIDNILKHYQNPKILILGRNNDDIDDYIGNVLFKEKGENKIRKIIYSPKPDLDITFMTIHQAKGLEANEVIVLNLEDRDGGFPNKMTDDPILSFVKDNDEEEFAEERRLLYVALTRSQNNVYLFTPINSSSQFINELMEFDGVSEQNVHHRIKKKDLPESSDFIKDIVIHPTHLDCPKEYCDGKISIIENNVRKTTYVRCCNHPRSKEHYDGGPYPKWALNDIKYVKKCPKCRGILVRNGDILKCCLNYNDGCMEKDELKLDKEDLEFDYD